LSFALLLAPLLLLASIYLASFLLLSWWHLRLDKLAALISIAVATAVTVALYDGGRWRLGLFVPPRLALRDFAAGVVLATLLVAVADALIVATTGMRHARGGGFPWREFVTVFAPAALHEELLFRGYAYQKLRTWSRAGAIAITAGIFALLHGGNSGVTLLAMTNILLAGVLLAFAYEAGRRLWLPIGIHLAWNVVSGPILGYGVSGYVAGATLFTTRGSGPAWLTGGTFGIEGSVWAVIAELAGIAVIMRRVITHQENT